MGERSSKLEEVLAKDKKSYKKYYTAIGATFAAGNAIAYFAYGMHGLLDAVSADFVTLGLTIYEQLKAKKENDKLEYYLNEFDKLEGKEKIGLISYGDKRDSESKVKKIGFIAYQLLKKDIGEQPEIEEAAGLSANVLDALESKGYVKRGLLGTRLTKVGKRLYSTIFENTDEEKKGTMIALKKLYRVPEDELVPIYEIYTNMLKKEKEKK